MQINYQKTYETLSYEEKIEFRDLTIKVIQEVYPHYSLKPFEPQNPDVIYITNQEDNVRIQFPLRDLYARFSQTARTRADLKDTVLSDYASIFKKIEDVEYFQNLKEPEWAEASNLVQPRLTNIEILPDELESFVYFPFGKGVVTAFIIYNSDEKMNAWISKELLEKWNVTAEELNKKALDNLADITEGMEFVGKSKPHDYLWNNKGSDYSASAILLGGMRYLLAQTIGSPYRFCVPSSFVIYSWAELDDEEFQIEMKAMMEREHSRLPGRLSTNIYEVDENGQIKQIKEQPKNPATQSFHNN